MKKFWQAALLLVFLEALGMLSVWASVFMFTNGNWISGIVFAVVGFGWIWLISYVFYVFRILQAARVWDSTVSCWDEIKDGVQ